jgi:hypothetical protein
VEFLKKGTSMSRTFAERCARTSLQKNRAGKFLTGDFVAVVEADGPEVHEARERAEVA